LLYAAEEEAEGDDDEDEEHAEQDASREAPSVTASNERKSME
jgi:hypothetical protein